LIRNFAFRTYMHSPNHVHNFCLNLLRHGHPKFRTCFSWQEMEDWFLQQNSCKILLLLLLFPEESGNVVGCKRCNSSFLCFFILISGLILIDMWSVFFFPNFLMFLQKWRSATREFSQIWIQGK
jgi:hypothetical protein